MQITPHIIFSHQRHYLVRQDRPSPERIYPAPRGRHCSFNLKKAT